MLLRKWLPVAAVLMGAGSPCIAQTLDPNVANYHADQAHSGKYVFPGLTWTVARTVTMDTSFDAPVHGHIYTQPLYWLPPGAQHGYVIVSTMSDIIEAHDAVTGALIWSTKLGADVPNSFLPCGGQNPWGVAGTPVIDETTGTLYVNGEVLVGGTTPDHMIFALNLATGAIKKGWPVDMDASMSAKGYADWSTLIQDQRGGLLFLGGKVYVAYGGHGLDCDNYHGWVAEFDPTVPQLVTAWESTGIKDGIWSPGGVSYDGTNIYVTTGNTARGTTTWADGEAVIQLPASLQHSTDPATYFSPTFWQSLDNVDKELGASNAVFLDVPNSSGAPYPWLFQIDKAGDLFIVSRTNLGGVGSGLLTLQDYISIDPVPPRTAPATYPDPDGSGVFVSFAGAAFNCPASDDTNYMTTVKVSANADGTPVVTTAWCASLKKALTIYPGNGTGAQSDRGSPMVTTTDGTNNPIVWEEGTEGDNKLRAYRGTDGAVLFDGGTTRMIGINRFATPLAVPYEHRIYVGAGDNVGGKNQVGTPEQGRLYSFVFGTPAPK